ncbi:MAG: molecular chaperone HtpG [Deferribacteres bacterium]|nr:molecular chaperone HtpG [candidate division KSB1 bacterium]MCB9503589.1 molecular chaperone HtpG [Deferribacteres bacterium]
MAKKTTTKAQEFEYKAEMKQMLHLIIHSLYTNKEIFLRELISNASDALNKIRFRMLTDKDVLDANADLKIKIEVNKEEHTLSVIDSGIGMTHEDLVERIGTVASSGTLEFVKQMQQQGKQLNAEMIGQFGVGFYSVFMVTDEVLLETRAADSDSKGYLWKSDGGGKYTIEEIEKSDRGTKITFKLKEDAWEFAEDYRIKHIIKKYSNFVDFPVYVGEEKVNTVEALWHRPKDDIKEDELNEFFKFVSNDFQDPAAHLQLNIEGAVNFKALLFIPESAPMSFFRNPDDFDSIHLYSNKIFIQDNCKELLPEYLRFIKGVVDTEDLPLNVSREVTQSSPVMVKIKNTLTSKILAFLKEMAEKEPEKFEKFNSNFGLLFKSGVNSDFTNRDKIIELLRFESTKTEKGKSTSLKDYTGRMGEKQKEIYFISGDHRESLEKNPKLEYFKKNDIEVLLLSEPIDVFIVPGINEYDKKPLKSIDKADLDLSSDEKDEKEELNEDLAKSLIDVFKETLGDKVEDVVASKRLVDSAVTLVSGKDGMDAQMEKMMKMMNKDFSGSKRILEVNMKHGVIKNLSRLNLASSTDPLLRKTILQLYESAELLEGNLESPNEFVARMTELLEQATKA